MQNKMKKVTTADADSLLPSKPTGGVKPTWLGSIPGSLLLAFERGHAFLEGFKIIIDKWAGKLDIYDDDDGARHMTMEQVVAILQASEKFPFIIFDTADMAAKMCSDHFCDLNGWQHVSEGGDFGKGYDIGQNTPFRQMFGKILSTGRGIGFITHSTVKETKTKKGDSIKKETSLPGGIYKFLHTQADLILHGSFGPKIKLSNGQKVQTRLLRTVGDDETLAGNRVRRAVIPSEFVVDTDDQWKQWSTFFTDPKAAAKATAYLDSLSLKNKKADADEADAD
jgi:hypothetical protein